MRLVLVTLLAALTLGGPAYADSDGGSDSKSDSGSDSGKNQAGSVVSTIDDDRITESSGLAVSTKYDDLAYTINDRGNHPTIYAIKVSTGDVVGVADVGDLDVQDTESIAVDEQGTLWLGDLGDNDHERDDVSIISFPEPGPGTHHVESADRYAVAYPDGATDVEGMLVQPTTDQVFLVSKNRDGMGTIFALPDLTPGATVTAEDLNVEAPRAVTDATFTHDGRWALLRTNTEVWVYDPTTWKPVRSFKTPKLDQGESIAVERDNRTLLLGSEGENSPIIRVALPETSAGATPINVTDPSRPNASVGTPVKLAIVIAIGVVVLGIGIVTRGRRRRR